jgi:hypothetical protein
MSAIKTIWGGAAPEKARSVPELFPREIDQSGRTSGSEKSLPKQVEGIQIPTLQTSADVSTYLQKLRLARVRQ